MPDLAGKPPIGSKTGKPGPKPRKPIPKQSARRKAYLTSDARSEGLAHMFHVKQLPCIVCGASPVEVHHEGFPRCDMNVLPLCPRHHRREFGPGAYHYNSKAFYALHGTSEELLARVEKARR